ncbi:single-stranded DNA-binding protein homolog sam-10-like [Papio anubis]|uniref:single-stranded DNA-binding protein homolog sam-10-like n=1 Tax=Papio anubis TaxID=9555 RepID=UPI000B7B22AF|nr:single-stranded DNA-binding protein homolog sam-10-like [Papio anubis]
MYFVLHFCTCSAEPRAALFLTGWSRDQVLLLERRARAAGTRRRGGPPAAAAGAESHHLFSHKRLRAWAEGAGEGAWGGGRRGAASPPPPPCLGNAPPAAIPADCRTPERSTHPRRPTVLDAPPRASPEPSGAGSSTPVGDSDRCRGGPGSYGARLASTTVSRDREHGVSPSPQRGRRSYSHYSGSTSGSRAGSAPPVLSLNHSPALGGPQMSDPELPSTSLARLASSSASSLGTRSPGRPAPRLP